MKKFLTCLFSGAAAAFGVSAALTCISAGAVWEQSAFMGDINRDSAVTIADAVLLTRHLLSETALPESAGFEADNGTIMLIDRDHVMDSSGMNTALLESEYAFICDDGIVQLADMVHDGRVDAFDLIQLRKMIANPHFRIPLYSWKEDPPVSQVDFIDAPIYDLYGSLPSQGDAKMVVFYVDFPDCRFDYVPSEEELAKTAFGAPDPMSPSHPFESLGAFYTRASKGSMQLSGETYTYTTSMGKSYYENDVWHKLLVDELIAIFDDKVDFSRFDGDSDGTIDTILICVPEKAGDDNWWPAAGIFGGNTYNRADGMNIGHVIVGNAEIKNGDCNNFVSSYVHEMGHCMGLPDFYLYHGDDFQGMHGSAGFELMDDAICDLGAASKLMLGWYTEDQISVYDKSMGTTDYVLYNAQTDKGNCVIIPCGELGDKYRSEFFIMEYTTVSGNNDDLRKEWWRATGDGVRIYHVEASVTGDYWFNSWKYASGEDEATNYDQGRRFIRLVGEGDDYTFNLLSTGSVVNGSAEGFRWYDSSGGQTVDPGIQIEIGEYINDSYIINITPIN